MHDPDAQALMRILTLLTDGSSRMSADVWLDVNRVILKTVMRLEDEHVRKREAAR